MIGRGPLAESAQTLLARFAADDLRDETQELFDGPQFIQGIDRALKVECHILVDQYVTESGKPLERPHEIGREPIVAGEIANGFCVVLETITAPRRQLARDVDDDLAHRQQ